MRKQKKRKKRKRKKKSSSEEPQMPASPTPIDPSSAAENLSKKTGTSRPRVKCGSPDMDYSIDGLNDLSWGFADI